MRAVNLKIGGVDIRYTIQIHGKERYLWFGNLSNARFVEGLNMCGRYKNKFRRSKTPQRYVTSAAFHVNISIIGVRTLTNISELDALKNLLNIFGPNLIAKTLSISRSKAYLLTESSVPHMRLDN